jgi:hypothetical protein
MAGARGGITRGGLTTRSSGLRGARGGRGIRRGWGGDWGGSCYDYPYNYYDGYCY